jgi:ATP-binding cassette subfamily B (MDR/TAP) protein 1
MLLRRNYPNWIYSALDSESEAIVQEALDKLMREGNQTIIAIAHRLSTIRNADIIAVVSGGKIVETGTHSELIAQEGAYYGLVEAQKGKKTGEESTAGSETASSSDPPSRRSSISSGVGDDPEEGDDGEVELNIGKEHVLDFHHVNFHYPTRPEQKIFRGLNLTVKEGETVALVGPRFVSGSLRNRHHRRSHLTFFFFCSGQGKSTIIQLIENFYRPTHGTIKYRGVDLKELNVKWYRSQIGLVSQEPVLFDTTIAENIRFGMPEATQEAIEASAIEANAHDFIMSFPDGYETDVGAGSTQVSGGQKQRIAIARALLRKPRVRFL